MTPQINLLPHRAAARLRQLRAFRVHLGLAVLVGVGCALMLYLWQLNQISAQRARNQMLQAENRRLDGQIKEVARLEEEIAALRARQQAVEALQADRNLAVQLLSEVGVQLPDGVYLTQLKQDSDWLVMQGMAQSNERVSELLRNLGTRSPRLAQPELVEIVATQISPGERDARRLANFTLRVKLMRPLPPSGPVTSAGAGRA